MAGFHWTEERKKAAQLVADRNLTYIEIAAECGVVRETLYEWRQDPEFIDRVKFLKDEYKRQVLSLGIANRFKRVERQNDTWKRLQKVMQERGEDPTMAEVPGGTTGTIVRQLKGIGKGDDFQIVEEYAIDTGLLREIARVEDMAAKELGQAGIITEVPPDLEEYPDASLSDDARS